MEIQKGINALKAFERFLFSQGPERVQIRGYFELLHRDSDGRVLDRREIKNLVVDAGKAGVASRINGAGGEAAFTFVAIGTGAVAPAAGDTALGAEITTGGGARAAGTATRVTTDVTNDTAQVVVTFSFTASFAVTESGLLNASSAGVLLSRQTFSAVNVANGDSLQVTWKVDVD